MKEHPLNSRDEWLKMREGYICASDVANLFGVGYGSAVDTYLSKVAGHELKDTFAMRDGRKLEAFLCELADEAIGEKEPNSLRDGLYLSRNFFSDGVLGATPDAFYINDEKELIPVQLKATSGYKFNEWTVEAPAHYQFQVMTELAVTGAPYGWLFIWCFGKEPLLYKIERDDQIIKLIRERAEKFWKSHVELNIPPLNGDYEYSADDVAKVYPESVAGKEVAISDTYLLTQYSEIKTQVAELTKKQDELKKEICLTLGDAERGICPGWKISWKTINANRLNTKAIKAEHPEIAEKFTEVSSYRRLDIKEVKEKGL